MSQDQWTAVDQYICHLMVPTDEALEAALRDSKAAGLPSINVAPNQGKLLQLLARSIGAKRILEIGTLGCYSTIWLARALPAGGKLISLEANATHAKVARANIERAGLTNLVEVQLGTAMESLAKLLDEKRGPFDLIFIDADKASMAEYLGWSMKLSHPGTVIIADNVVRKGAVTDAASTDENVVGVRRFNEKLAAEPRLSATEIQTVGSKGYDGFAFIFVT